MRDYVTERAAVSPEPAGASHLHGTRPGAGDAWGVVLAGGQGMRLRPLIRRIYGDDRPKQFASLVGSRSLLRQTIDRISPVISPERTVTVIHRSHSAYLAEALGDAHVRHILRQPEDRGTASGVLFPVHWIHHRDPHAVVAIFPSDHFVHEEQRFIEHIGQVVDAVRRHPEWLVLLGAVPTDADPDYGWIEPGEPVGYTELGDAISSVRRFWEKPSPLAARECLEQGWLWNTFVFVASAAALLDLSRQFLPRLDESLSLMAHCWDTEKEAWALDHAYGLAPSANLSHCILERRPASLVVSRLPAITWSDWGRPERVIRSLKTAQLLPAWFQESDVRRDGEPRHGALVRGGHTAEDRARAS